MTGLVTRRRAGFVAIACVLVIGIAWVMAILTQENRVRYDPQNPGARGAQAVAGVLHEQGVDVRRISSIGAAASPAIGRDTAVLVSDPATLSADRLRELGGAVRGSARLILVTPDPALLADAFGLPAGAGRQESPTPAGECGLAWGRGLRMPGNSIGYRAPQRATSCFTTDGLSAAYELPAGSERPAILVLGSADLLTNGTVKNGDNAALALRSLGQTPRLVWYSGGFDAGSAVSKQRSVLPSWVAPALWLGAAALLLTMFWRGRRLGALVTEPLPVIVAANESTVARGLLYRRARDTARTAEVLRAATRQRLQSRLGLPPGAPAAALIRQIAAHTGRDEHELHALLAQNPETLDETTLCRLAEDLSALERQARG